MTFRAFILFFLMLMNQAMMDAFGQISGAEIISGCVDLYAPMSGTIHAFGRRNGKIWDIKVEWIDGYPRGPIMFTDPQSEL